MEFKEQQWKILFDVLPIPVIIADSEAIVIEMNPAAKEFLKNEDKNKRFGDIFHCLRAAERGCGTSQHCRNCTFRKAINSAYEGQCTTRQWHRAVRVLNGQAEKFELSITASPFVIDGKTYAVVVIEDVTELSHLRKIIPICMYCKRIRDDKNFWQAVDEYMTRYHGVDFSHGICPECAKKYYPEIFNED